MFSQRYFCTLCVGDEMTTSEKLDKKIKDSPEWIEFERGYYEGYSDGANLLKPLLLEMYELVNDIEPSVLPESHRDRRRSILIKFEEFLK